MKILFVASECAPFIKTGGLADVIGAVPKALEPLGGDVRVLLPAYPALSELAASGQKVMDFGVVHGGPAHVVAVKAAGINLLLLVAPHLFDRGGTIYLDESGNDWKDNHLRYGALSEIGAMIATDGVDGWLPDLVNAHDWQAGLVPAYLKQSKKTAPPCILTIHNIAFQGLFDASICSALKINKKYFTSEGAEYYGMMGFLKAGISFSDKITTVSPTYARELMSPEFGMGLEGLLNARRGDLVGILNGIDLDVWNPKDDADLPTTYHARALKGKSDNRLEVEKRFGLDGTKNGPLFCVISRLTTQKGLDLLLEALPNLVGRGAKLALLGTGDKALEGAFAGASHQYAGSVGTIIGYDEGLSHLLQGGSDAILIPSRFEPCGLTQLYGLRYGTLPVVARTGGLADTVIDANDAALQAGCATGVQFSPINSDGLNAAIDRTIDLYHQPKVWAKMMGNAMRHDVGWEVSAAAYYSLFTSVIKARSATK